MEAEFKNQGLRVLGWRKVPVRTEIVGKIAAQTEPKIMQIFVGKGIKNLLSKILRINYFVQEKSQNTKYMNPIYLKIPFFMSPAYQTELLYIKVYLFPKI